jgi:hypothetical protein
MLAQHHLDIEVFLGINSVIGRNGPFGKIKWLSAISLLTLCTARSQWDTQYLQYAFRARMN